MQDAIVIGGGPVGSRVASRLAANGHRVVVLEQKKDLEEPICCTGIIGQECVKRFDIDDSVVFRRVNSARVFSPTRDSIRLWRPEPQASVVDRVALNRLFAGRAQDKGVKYLLDSQVENIQVNKDGVNVELRYRKGRVSSFKARVAVIATGFGSRLVKDLGLGRVGDSAVGAQIEVEVNDIDEIEVYLGRKTAPGFFAWLVPTYPGHALVGILSRARPGFYLKRLMSSLEAQGKIITTGAKISFAGVSLKPLTKTHRDRLIVAGGAAGQAKPITGGGIYYGLLCADIAADNLLLALENDNLSTTGLANYDREWRNALGKEIRVGHWGRRFYELLSDRQIDRLFSLIKSNNIDEALLAATDLSFDWHGKPLLRLLGHGVLTRTVRAMKLPISILKG